MATPSDETAAAVANALADDVALSDTLTDHLSSTLSEAADLNQETPLSAEESLTPHQEAVITNTAVNGALRALEDLDEEQF